MDQERMSSLALMNIHYEIEIVLDEVGNLFEPMEFMNWSWADHIVRKSKNTRSLIRYCMYGRPCLHVEPVVAQVTAYSFLVNLTVSEHSVHAGFFHLRPGFRLTSPLSRRRRTATEDRL